MQDRIQRGSYHPKPARRVYIPKAGGGGERPLGIPALDDKIVQRAARSLLEPIYDKTRVIRFGRSAPTDCAKDDRRRPETFDFLGFTHIASREPGKCFRILRRTSRKKRKIKLAALTREARKRRSP